jgi:multidrug efflux pump subunit AcrB
MWIVRLALRNPYTIAVACFVLMLMAVLSGQRMAVDIFPLIDIPVVAVVWTYPGMLPSDMEARVVLLSERNMSSTVNGISRIESQSEYGVGLVKVYFQPGTDIATAIAQIVSSSQTAIKAMPPGITPPYVIQSNASNVPVAQVTMSSATMPEQDIADYGQNFLRLRLFTIPGLATPQPYGGKVREITIDVDPHSLNSKGLAAQDVLTALQESNIILPAGTARIGNREYDVAMNSSPPSVSGFQDIPIKVVNGAEVTIGDVARVRDGFAEQTSIVRVDGRRAAYLTILKKADASTLAVVEATRAMLPKIREVAPHGLDVRLDFDQSKFVRAAIGGVLREGLTAALLVGLMIFAFLGSWRSVVIACISIPLAMATAVIGLNLTGNSFNIMTLGGLSLAIGLLVDDATVTIENIHRNRAMGKPLTVAILDAAGQIATPVIVATLSICIVFFPVVLLQGPARFLFIPIALAVVIAMLASYVLSRSLVPTLARMMLVHEPLHDPEGIDVGASVALPPPVDPHAAPGVTLARRLNDARDRHFARLQAAYGRFVTMLIARRWFTVTTFAAFVLISLCLVPTIGQDFFPSTDAGIMKLHYRAPSGTRIEHTEELVRQVENRIRQIIPASELVTVNSTIGIPGSLNLAFVPTDNTSGMDAEILIQLAEHHRPTQGYVTTLRDVLNREFPGSTVYFQTADIVGQVLNFGLSAPIDVQIQSQDLNRAYAMARTLRDQMREVPGAVDVTVKQVLDYPTIHLDVDRERAAQLGISQRDAANSMLVSLSSSVLVAPSYFVNPANQVNYPVAVEVPLPKMTSAQDVLATPVTAGTRLDTQSPPWNTNPFPHAPVQTLDNIAQMRLTAQPTEIDHYTVARVLDVTANVQGRDLGAVVSGIQKKVGALGKLPPGMTITVRGQGEVMHDAFQSLGLGFVVAVLLVFSLMAVLFQSWIDPIIIMGAVPGAIAGILWMLVLTHTTINIESLLGSIMAVGIAVANSILVVTFANEQRVERGMSVVEAAIEAGQQRLRPVLMTAGAMLLGMLPMAIGAGEGGEQNAPLGRAVIGGLSVATIVTLCVVPVIYTILARRMPGKYIVEQRFEAEAQGLEYHGPQ